MKDLLKNTIVLITVLMCLGAFLRFYNLNWGAPFYFHPDERNIASSISQLRFPNQMNPNFFAYGSLPIYKIYSTGLIINQFRNFQLPFNQAIIIGRFYSAILSTLLIPLIYIIGKKIHNKKTGLLASFFTATSVGLIQFAHFGTFEIWITFFSLILFLECIYILKRVNVKDALIVGLLLGILVSIKISNAVFIIIPFLSLLLTDYANQEKDKNRLSILKLVARKIVLMGMMLAVGIVIYFITNPYVIFDFPSFKNSINYESGVALGTTNVFYTHEFFNSVPVLFQFTRVYPFLLNPLLTFLFIPSFFYISWVSIRTKNKNFLLLITLYLILFLSQAFLFVKWTRYMLPTIPYTYLIISIALTSLLREVRVVSRIKFQVLSIIGTFCLIFTFSYFITVLVKPDTRIIAAQWASKHLDANKNTISESYDLGIIAFNSHFSHITLCDFYYYEKNPYPCNGISLDQTLARSSYIVLPSERLLKMAITQKEHFPKRYKFYSKMFNDNSKYQLVYKTPCDIFCKIIYLNNPLTSYEQTANVFDRPTVYIFNYTE